MNKIIIKMWRHYSGGGDVFNVFSVENTVYKSALQVTTGDLNAFITLESIQNIAKKLLERGQLQSRYNFIPQKFDQQQQPWEFVWFSSRAWPMQEKRIYIPNQAEETCRCYELCKIGDRIAREIYWSHSFSDQFGLILNKYWKRNRRRWNKSKPWIYIKSKIWKLLEVSQIEVWLRKQDASQVRRLRLKRAARNIWCSCTVAIATVDR